MNKRHIASFRESELMHVFLIRAIYLFLKIKDMLQLTNLSLLRTTKTLMVCLILTTIISCDDDDETPKEQIIDKSGIFTGTFNYQTDGFDTAFQDLEFTVTKQSNDNYIITNKDLFDVTFVMKDNKGSLSLVDGSEAGLTTSVGTLTTTNITLSGNGESDGEAFSFTYGGVKKGTGGGGSNNNEEYFIFDGKRYNADASATNCRLETAPFSFYFIGMYTLTGGAGCIVRFKTTPTPGTYQVASYQSFIDEDIPANACTVSVDESFTASGYYSTGTSGTVVVTESNGKIKVRISDAALAYNPGETEKILSDGILLCK